MNNKFRVFLKGIFDVSPLMIPVVPFGLIFGVLSIDIGFSPIETMGMSLIVFGGASQIVLLQLFSGGASSDKYFHLFGGGITCWVIWQTTTFLGIVLGAFIPEKLGLSFAVPLTFLALLVNDFRKLINVIVIIISGLVATFGFNYVPYKAYVIVAGVTALLTAAILTKLNKKNE